MAITTYAELVATLDDWLNRSDLSGQAPEFIALSEAWFNREIRHPQMEAEATSVLAAGDTELALPDDFLAARTIYLDDNPDNVLVAMSPMNLRATYPYTTAGEMRAYAISGSTIQLAPPATGDGTLTLAYYQSIPALTSTNTTNWLLTAHPDLYLRAARFHAYDYINDDVRAERELARVVAIVDSINRSGNRRRTPAGPLSMRPVTSA